LSQSEVVTATITIAAPPAAVFPYFTDPNLLVRWIGDTAELAPEPGGLFALDMGETRVRGSYIAVDPPNRVVFTWGVLDSETLPSGSTTVEIRLTADGDQTIVELSHRDLPFDWRARHRDGWTKNLGVLERTARA
jgi:uncharacterized protein YndB with AHSA1/START domain